jgi:hypothetical protein
MPLKGMCGSFRGANDMKSNSTTRGPATRARAMLIPLALWFLPACDLKYVDQEVLIQHDPATDSLDVLLIYRGLTATADTPDAVGKALAIAQRILGGRREFEVNGWPWHFDLDDPAACDGMEPECAQVLQGISIEAQEPFLDPEGRLSAYQLLRVPGFAQGLDCLNRSISRQVLENAGDAKPDGMIDERTIGLWVERAQSGAPWIHHRLIRSQEGVFEFDLPASDATADAVQRALIDEITMKSKGGEWRDLASFLAHLQSFKREDERVVLRIGAPVTGVFHFSSHNEEVPYFPGLLQALEAAGLRAGEGPSLDAVRGILLPEGGEDGG